MSNYAFKIWVEQQTCPKVLIGFDIGLKYTGVSITSSDLKHAFVSYSIILVSEDFERRFAVKKDLITSNLVNFERKTNWSSNRKTKPYHHIKTKRCTFLLTSGYLITH